MRIFPEMWASTLWPFSSSTRNIAFGRGSTTVPSSTIASSLGLARTELLDCRIDGPTGSASRHQPGPGPKGDASAGTAEVQLDRLGVERAAGHVWREHPTPRPRRQRASPRGDRTGARIGP